MSLSVRRRDRIRSQRRTIQKGAGSSPPSLKLNQNLNRCESIMYSASSRASRCSFLSTSSWPASCSHSSRQGTPIMLQMGLSADCSSYSKTRRKASEMEGRHERSVKGRRDERSVKGREGGKGETESEGKEGEKGGGEEPVRAGKLRTIERERTVLQ